MIATAAGGAFDLGQHMGGEQDSRAPGGGFGEQGEELALDERVQAGGGFVEDQHVRLVAQRLDDADFLPVAFRQRAETAGRVEVQALGQFVDAGVVVAVTQPPVPGEQVPCRSWPGRCAGRRVGSRCGRGP